MNVETIIGEAGSFQLASTKLINNVGQSCHMYISKLLLQWNKWIE